MTLTYTLAGVDALLLAFLVLYIRRYLRLKADFDRVELKSLMLACALEDSTDAPAEVIESIGSYSVIRTVGDFDIPVKAFPFTRTPGARDYARNCAEELADKLNEKI